MIMTKQTILVMITVLFVILMASSEAIGSDWLVRQVKEPVEIEKRLDGRELVLSNGLISRTFLLRPNAATVAYDNLMTGESIIRGIKPEAIVELDGQKYEVGGLQGQIEYAYLQDGTIESLSGNPDAFAFKDFELGDIKERFSWKRKRYSAQSAWPPAGKSLTLHFLPPGDKLKGMTLSIQYELYQGIPLLAKRLTIHNGGDKPVRLNTFTSEILAAVEYESLVGEPAQWEYPNIHIESDYEFGGDDSKNANKTAYWVTDPQYSTQVNYQRKTPAMLEVRPPIGPDIMIEQGETFESFRIFELIYDSTERERKGLSLRRMYRTIAPWSTENPIIMHVRNADAKSVRLAIDQCAEVGFEMVIMTFGSGFKIGRAHV